MLHAFIVRSTLALVLLLTQASLIQTAQAADEAAWPTKQVALVVPYPPGAITDTVGRRLGNQLGMALGVPVVIENKAGAGANLGAAYVSNAQPNGATILFTSYGNIMIDSVTEAQHKLTPVAAVGPMTVVMLVRPDLPYKTIEEMVAYARAHPQKISFASVGIGSSYHLLIEQMNTLGKLDMVHIPYKGGAASMADFLGGRVDVMLATWLFAKPYVADNRARAVALVNGERSPTLPNLPTVNEQAVPGVKLIDGLGVFAPKGLPQALVARLNKEINRIIQEPEMKAWLTNEAIPPTATTTAAFEKMLIDEAKPLDKLIRENKIGMK
jgi:tripartite-type tricarboxylate transporter receptor subunit TctC